MKCLVLNGWHDDNKGDSAIVLGLLGLLADVSNALTDMAIMSQIRGASSDPKVYRFLKKAYPRIRIYENPAPTANRPSGLGKRFADVYEAMRLMVSAHRGHLSPELKELASYDIAISKGGHIVFAVPGIKGLLGLFLNLFPIMLLQALRVPVFVVGQSVGPLESHWSRRLVHFTFSRCAGVWVRDKRSQLLLSQIGVKSSVCPDTAFYLKAERPPHREEAYVVVTTRQWYFPYSHVNDRAELYGRYLTAISSGIEYWVERGYNVVLVAHTVGPTESEDDRISVQHVSERLGETAKRKLKIVTQDLSPLELMNLYGGAYAMIGTRFHSVIMALTSGVPAVAISYHGPKASILADMGYPELVVPINSISGERIREVCNLLYCDREAIAADLRRKVIQLRQNLIAMAREMLELANATNAIQRAAG